MPPSWPSRSSPKSGPSCETNSRPTAGRPFAYGTNLEFVLFQSWKQYRGGSLGYIAIFDPGTGEYSELPRGNWNDVTPMWHGDDIYFLSDRDGRMNLYRYGVTSKSTLQLTSYTEWDVKNPAAGPDCIVFENGGLLFTLGFATQSARPLPVSLPDDSLPSRERQTEWQQATGGVAHLSAFIALEFVCFL